MFQVEEQKLEHDYYTKGSHEGKRKLKLENGFFKKWTKSTF